MTARSCPTQPVGGMAGERTVCERDGDAWYGAGGGRHEYALVEKGHVLKVSGDSTKVTRAVLRSAHRPSEAELAGGRGARQRGGYLGLSMDRPAPPLPRCSAPPRSRRRSPGIGSRP